MRFYALCLSSLLASCAGDGPDDPESVEETAPPPASLTIDFETQIQPVLDSHCSCHLNVIAPEGVVLLPGAAYDSLVNVTSTGDPGRLLVEPGDPDESVLVIKVDDSSSNVSSRVGDRMPQGLAPLSNADVATIRQWIDEGAQRSAQREDVTPPDFDGAGATTPVSSAEIDVFWNSATDDNSLPETILYNLYLATRSGGHDFLEPSRTTAPGSTSIRVGNLQPQTDYFFVVRAVDEAGNEDANAVEVSARTLDLPGTGPPPGTLPNRPPVADAGGPYDATAGEPVLLSGSGSTDEDGDPLTFEWSFGDGESGDGESVEHTYAESGMFTVTLVVNDGQADSAPTSTTVTVADNRFPRDPVMDDVCSQCHGIRIILGDGTSGAVTPPGLGEAFFAPGTFLNGRVRSRTRWESTVDRMRDRNGANMTDEERALIVDFLSENYSDDTN